MTLLFANNATSTLAGAITNVALTANLAAGSGPLFPAPSGGDYFCLTFNDAATRLLREIVHVTNVTGDTITMVRGQESTTPLNWLAGDLAANLWTAGSAQTMVQTGQLQLQTQNYAEDTGTANAMVIALTPAPVSLASLIGAPVRVKKGAATNTGAVTLTINGLAATAVTYADASPINAAQFPAHGILEVFYDGTQFECLSFTPQAVRLYFQQFQSSGTYTIISDSVKVTVTGAGGGGAGTNGGATAFPSGGGSGSTLVKYLTQLTLGHTLTVTVGSGGAGGGTANAGGSNGSSSVVSSGTQTISTLTGGAGHGATSPTGAAGVGGTATGGDINQQGAGGTPGPSSGIGGSSSPFAPYGNGGGVPGNGAVVNGHTIASQEGAQGIVTFEAV